jgi:hypothetical protein
MQLRVKNADGLTKPMWVHNVNSTLIIHPHTATTKATFQTKFNCTAVDASRGGHSMFLQLKPVAQTKAVAVKQTSTNRWLNA